MVNIYFLLLVFLVQIVLAESVDRDGQIDLSGLKCAPQLRQAIAKHMPSELARSLASAYESDVIEGLLLVQPYKASQRDSSNRLQVAYLTDARDLGYVQIYSQVDTGYVLVSTDSTAGTGYPAVIDFYDFDCDGWNEILVRCLVGNAAMDDIDVLVLDTVSLNVHNVTQDWFPAGLYGRNVTIRRLPNGCATQIEVSTDGPAKFVPETKRTYHFDPGTMHTVLVKIDSLR